MKKILLATLLTVTASSSFASPFEVARKKLCVNLMVTAHSYIEASQNGLPKSGIKSIIDRYDTPELHELLDLIYHPVVRNGKTNMVWEFVHDHCESVR